MSFDPGVFDPQLFGAGLMADSCLFDGAIFDSAVFDVCEEAVETPVAAARVVVGDGQPSWEESVRERYQQVHGRLEAKVKERNAVTRKIAAVKKKIETEKVEGILANLYLLEERKQTLTREIKDLRIEIKWVNLEVEDEDDVEVLLLH